MTKERPRYQLSTPRTPGFGLSEPAQARDLRQLRQAADYMTTTRRTVRADGSEQLFDLRRDERRSDVGRLGCQEAPLVSSHRGLRPIPRFSKVNLVARMARAGA